MIADIRDLELGQLKSPSLSCQITWQSAGIRIPAKLR